MPDHMTQREMIEQVYHAVYDDGGLRDSWRECRVEITEIKVALTGGLNGKPGAITRLDGHIEEHKRERRRNLAILGTIATVLATAIPELLRRLGLL